MTCGWSRRYDWDRTLYSCGDRELAAVLQNQRASMCVDVLGLCGRQRRRASGGNLFRPDGFPADVRGLGGMSVLTAAAMDDKDVPWCVDSSGPGASRPTDLINLMERCLDNDPGRRPLLDDVQALLQAELARPRRDGT